MSHTKEPWEANGVTVYETGTRNVVLDCVSHSYNMKIAEANARRIVACVNACAGISSDTLESYTSAFAAHGGNFDTCLEKAIQQRDELVAALNEIAKTPAQDCNPVHEVNIRLDIAFAALEKAGVK